MVPVSKLSNSKLLNAGGGVPFKVKGLYLSKLEPRVGATMAMLPPLGACGFTYSKWLKSGGYLISPNWA